MNQHLLPKSEESWFDKYHAAAIAHSLLHGVSMSVIDWREVLKEMQIADPLIHRIPVLRAV